MDNIKTSRFTFILVCLCVFTGVLGAGTITVNPNSPNVEEKATISLTPSCAMEPKPVRWDFGDGTVIWAMATTVTHEYLAPGAYTISARYTCLGPAPIQVLDQKTVNVVERRKIRYTPANPKVDEMIIFRAVNFLDNEAKWDFGDGTIITLPKTGGPTVVSHTYTNPGTYIVKAWDFGGASQIAITRGITVQQAVPASISFTPQNPRVGEQVTYTAHDFTSPTTIRWDFGDGTVINLPPPTATHIYNQPGTYLVRAYDGGGQTVTATVNIVIHPPAAITFTPQDPRPGENIIFTAQDFFFNVIRWNFGDGTIRRDTTPPNISHAYAQPGIYLVRAYDNDGSTLTAQIQVTVLPARQITHSPQNPRTGEVVTFHAVNFNEIKFLWDFGDGTPRQRMGTTTSHVYPEEGIYTVWAYDRRGQGTVPVSITLTVAPGRGPRADFALSYIHLRFEDGKAYKVVPLHFSPLIAYADIKFEGSGILSLQWMLDGIPFSFVSERLSQSLQDQITFDSGPVPGLPTISPGIHEVTLNILSPQTDYAIPAIRYYVTVEEEEEMINIDFSQASTLESEDVVLTVDSIQTPSQQYFILQGFVRNESPYQMPFVLMRVYLDHDLVDQKLFRDFEPLESRDFETSVFNPNPTPKKIYILLYNISKKPAELMFMRELNVIHKKYP